MAVLDFHLEMFFRFILFWRCENNVISFLLDYVSFRPNFDLFLFHFDYSLKYNVYNSDNCAWRTHEDMKTLPTKTYSKPLFILVAFTSIFIIRCLFLIFWCSLKKIALPFSNLYYIRHNKTTISQDVIWHFIIFLWYYMHLKNNNIQSAQLMHGYYSPREGSHEMKGCIKVVLLFRLLKVKFSNVTEKGIYTKQKTDSKT